MPRAQYIINDPMFCEFVYHQMVNAPKDAILELSARERLYFKSKTYIRRFADKETLEKRLEMLARIGIPYTIVLAPRRLETYSVLDEVATQYKYVEKRKALIEAMSRGDMFVISSNDVLMVTLMAAQNSHTRLYMLNPEYVRRARIIKGMNTYMNSETMEAIEGFELLSQIILKSALNFEHAPAICELSTYELKILLALLPNRNTMTSAESLAKMLDESPRTTKGPKKICTGLERIGYIARMPGVDSEGKALGMYTITGMGISAVIRYLKFVSKEALE